MAEIINLRRARKRRDREETAAKADANAARHGRPKADRDADEAEARRADRAHGGHKVEDDG